MSVKLIQENSDQYTSISLFSNTSHISLHYFYLLSVINQSEFIGFKIQWLESTSSPSTWCKDDDILRFPFLSNCASEWLTVLLRQQGRCKRKPALKSKHPSCLKGCHGQRAQGLFHSETCNTELEKKDHTHPTPFHRKLGLSQ